MKKIFTILLALSMLVFAGCNSETGKTGETETTVFSGTTAEMQTTSAEKSTTEATEKTTEKKTETTTVKKEIPSTTNKAPAAKKPAVKVTEAPEKKKEKNICYIQIDCRNILKNKDSLNKAKESFVPENGLIVEKTAVEFTQGDTADELLKKICNSRYCTDNCRYCRKNGIQFEITYTPAYDSYYLEGVHQLYAGDCGGYSGWMYKVNGQFIMEASSEYKVKKGDFIEWVYTCDGGPDVGLVF